MHVDLHSGLGKYGAYKLLLSEPADSPAMGWYRATFGTEFVEPHDDAESSAYRVSGLMGAGIAERMRGREYRFAVAEFGTYSVIQVLAALRAENCALLLPAGRAGISAGEVGASGVLLPEVGVFFLDHGLDRERRQLWRSRHDAQCLLSGGARGGAAAGEETT